MVVVLIKRAKRVGWGANIMKYTFEGVNTRLQVNLGRILQAKMDYKQATLQYKGLQIFF